MLIATTVQTKEELTQIHQLNQKNFKQNLTAKEMESEGFVSWLYSIELLQKMHELAPSIIVKDGERVAGYALTTLIDSRKFHADLENMFQNLESVSHQGRPLLTYRFYCMGQICIDKAYRGKGVFSLLYHKHKEVYSERFDFILTEISTSNRRSIRAHEQVGFETIHQYTDATDQWNVVVWNWE